jgi:hypothetical protein
MRRRIAKWAGLIACLLVGALWIVSDRCTISRFGRVLGWDGIVTLDAGRVRLFCHQRSGDTRAGQGEWWIRRRDTAASVNSVARRLGWPGWPSASSTTAGTARMFSLNVPLWLPVAPLAVPVILLWWNDRGRVRPGGCRGCRYDLSGLPAGAPCPECGRRAAGSGAAPVRIMPA